jgi:hypothetical protein
VWKEHQGGAGGTWNHEVDGQCPLGPLGVYAIAKGSKILKLANPEPTFFRLFFYRYHGTQVLTSVERISFVRIPRLVSIMSSSTTSRRTPVQQSPANMVVLNVSRAAH